MIADGATFRSRSGRPWRAHPSRFDRNGTVRLYPVGAYSSGGGVKSRAVEVERLVDETHGWSRER